MLRFSQHSQLKCCKTIFLEQNIIFFLEFLKHKCWFPHLHNLLEPASRKQHTCKWISLFNPQLRIEDWGLWIDDWGVKTEDWGPRTADWGPRTEDRGLKTEDWGPRTEDRGLRTEDWRVKTEEWTLRTEDWGMPFSPPMAGLTFTLWNHKNPLKLEKIITARLAGLCNLCHPEKIQEKCIFKQLHNEWKTPPPVLTHGSI